MNNGEITLYAIGSGKSLNAPLGMWLKCLIEMLPPAQLAELAKRVEAAKGATIVAPRPRHHVLRAETGHLGLKGHKV